MVSKPPLRPRSPRAVRSSLARLVVAAALSSFPAVASAEPEPMPLAQPSAPLPPLPPPAPPSAAVPPPPPPATAPVPRPIAPASKSCVCDSDDAASPCERPCERDPKRAPSPGSFVIGIRSQITQTKAPSGSSDSVGVTFAGRFESHNDDSGLLASRGGLSFGIGGGSGDVEGIFGGSALVGVRAPVSRHHAPFLRVGLSGEYQGNSLYLLSRFDLPLGELGYQYVRRGTLFEVGARMSPVLTGRFRATADTRVLSSAFSYGAFLTARGEGGRVDLLYTRVQSTDGLGRAVDSFQGIGCVLPFGVFALCIDGQIVGTSVSFGGAASQNLRGAYFGGLFGLGLAGLR